MQQKHRDRFRTEKAGSNPSAGADWRDACNASQLSHFKVITIIFYAHWYFIPRGLEISKV